MRFVWTVNAAYRSLDVKTVSQTAGAGAATSTGRWNIVPRGPVIRSFGLISKLFSHS